MKRYYNVTLCGGGGTCLNAPDEFSGFLRINECDVLNFKKGFTLAEMMVVMLILSIVMAAFAPVVTTRSKADRNSPWRYSADNSNIYYGLGENQTAMIGQPNKVNGTDPSSRLIINTSDDTQKHIVFKRGENVLGNLSLSTSSVILGDGSLRGNSSVGIGIGALRNNSGNFNVGIGINTLANSTGASNTAIGDSALTSNTSGTNNSAMGTALNNNTSGSKNTALGDDSMTTNTTGSNNTAVGVNALNANNSSENTAIGYKALFNSSTANNTALGALANSTLNNTSQNTTALGYNAQATSNYSVAVGSNSNASGTNSISIGYNTEAQFLSVAIGNSAKATADNSAVGIAIGNGAKSTNVAAIAMGAASTASGNNSIAIGQNTKTSDYSYAIGYNAKTLRQGGIAIGHEAQTGKSGSSWGDYAVAIGNSSVSASDYGVSIGYKAGNGTSNSSSGNVAIGYNACQNVTGSYKTCIGYNSGPDAGHAWATDSTERIFIGSKSKYNNGPAVLEVHNDSGNESHELRNKKKGGSYTFSKTAVVVNGNLYVKGAIFSSPPEPVAGEVNPFTFQWSGTNDGFDNQVSAMWTNADDTSYYYNYGYWRTSSPYSDRRLKYVGSEAASGLDKIKQLKVFNYTFKNDKDKTPHVGVIAQDLQKIFPSAVKKDEKGYLTVRLEDMFYALINAVKELALKTDKNEQKIVKLEKENQELKSRLDKLEKKLK